MHERITQRQVFTRYLTEAEEKRLFKHLGALKSPLADRDLQWMTLARQTGLRIGSIAGLTVGDAKEALSSGIAGQGAHLRVRDEIAKGKRGYSVSLNQKAAAALRALLRLRKEQQLPQDDAAALIWSRQGERMKVRQFQQRMRHWCEEAQLSVKASPHWLRHTLAKRIMERSTSSNPLASVMSSLGHGSIDSTVVYTLPGREQLVADMNLAQ
jgi:site-specific recombinase XerC